MVTEEESAPQFSDAYRQAESAFFQQFNEVDFYVEDEDQENFYFCILKKLLPEVRFENIFPHKGKARVIKHAVENQLPRKSIYVVDKDFDDVLRRQHQQENVFYLDRYCIENYVLEEKAVIKFVIDEKPRLKSNHVQAKLQFSSNWDDIVRQLTKPFVFFFGVQKYNIEALKHTSHRPDCFCSADKCSVDEKSISLYAKLLLKKAAAQRLVIDLPNEIKRCDALFEIGRKTKLSGRHVSGEFILCLFAHCIGKLFDLKNIPELRSFAFRLVQECELNSLRVLQKSICAYLKSV